MWYFFWFFRQPGFVGFAFEVVKELFNGRENIVGKKIVNLDSVKKAVNDEDVSDDTKPYAGYKVWIMCFLHFSQLSQIFSHERIWHTEITDQFQKLQLYKHKIYSYTYIPKKGQFPLGIAWKNIGGYYILS